MEILCKWHVIVKYILGHDSKELFRPVIACAFWLNIVLQSLIHIAYIDPFGISINSEITEFVIIAFFLSTIGLLYVAIKNEPRYSKADKWFTSLNNDVSTKVKIAVGALMLLSFLIFMPWSIFIM